MANPVLIQNYQLGESLGKGAFGQVYRALNWTTGETVAVKTIQLSNLPQSGRDIIMSEIDLLKNLNHPNIVTYRGYVKTHEYLYIILEQNGSLHSICKNFGKFPENLVAVYTSQVLKGLVYLHERGVVHRDIKSANVLTNKDGMVKLTDFGLAATLAGALNTTNVVGSPYWSAPEVIEQSSVTTASDVWSVGCMVVELLEGRPPYHFLDPTIAHSRIIQDDYPPIPEACSPIMKDFLCQCFQKDCNLRISAKELLKHPWMSNAQNPIETDNVPDQRPLSDYVQAVQKVRRLGEALKSPYRPAAQHQTPRTQDQTVADPVNASPASRLTDASTQNRGMGFIPPVFPSQAPALQLPETKTGGKVPAQLAHRATTVSIPSHESPISRSMFTDEVIARLGDHGCQNITYQLDPDSCSVYPISSGGFGDVYRGRLIDGFQVAIKTMRIHVNTDKDRKLLKNAARELHTWSKCQHPNVLPLLGLVGFRDQIGMVSHWMENGSLPSYLERHPEADRCRLSAEICEGLAYLHAVDIVHGDLKGLNVLISADEAPVLTDFGNAVLQGSTLQFTATTSKPSLSPRWTAPELMEGPGMYSFAADVYALGMTILEVITGEPPYSNKSDHGVYFAVAIKKESPMRPEVLISSASEDGNKLWMLLTTSWAYKPEDRPSADYMRDVVKTITQEGLKRARAEKVKDETEEDSWLFENGLLG
ncbi:kinase-like protein [Ceratobasidium sp. AG-I]|nr:kinase-like protein [Ceratobasidium sp. AG-I]